MNDRISISISSTALAACGEGLTSTERDRESMTDGAKSEEYDVATDRFADVDEGDFLVAKGIEPEDAPWGCDYCIGHATYYLLAREGATYRCDDHLPPALSEWPERRGAALSGAEDAEPEGDR